jgi:hypothetical protein
VRFVPYIRRQGARVSLFSLKTKVDGFSRFDLKIVGYGSSGLASKLLARVSRFGHQDHQLWIDDFTHKITMMVSWFGPKSSGRMFVSLRIKTDERDEDGVRTHIEIQRLASS